MKILVSTFPGVRVCASRRLHLGLTGRSSTELTDWSTVLVSSLKVKYKCAAFILQQQRDIYQYITVTTQISLTMCLTILWIVDLLNPLNPWVSNYEMYATRQLWVPTWKAQWNNFTLLRNRVVKEITWQYQGYYRILTQIRDFIVALTISSFRKWVFGLCWRVRCDVTTTRHAAARKQS